MKKHIFILTCLFLAVPCQAQAIYLNASDTPYACCPIPGDSEVIEGEVLGDNIYTSLDFIVEADTFSCEAFFGDEPAQVYSRDPNVSLGPPPSPLYPTKYWVGFPSIEPYTESLVRTRTYYWCVDVTDPNNTVWQGPVWSFVIFGDKASDPNPADGQELVNITPILSWQDSNDAQWHVIYFGTSFDDVNNAMVQPLVPPPLSYRGYQPIGDEDWNPFADGGLTIELDTIYYWRIDEGFEELAPPVGSGTVAKGDVWSFVILGDKASDPTPPDNQKLISPTPKLSWVEGINAQWHVIYFGTSFDDVSNDVVQPLVPPPLSYRGYRPADFTFWEPVAVGGLTIELGTTYYWRIDEGLEELPPPVGGGMVVKGDVWSFTTVSEGPGTIRMDLWWNVDCYGFAITCLADLMLYDPYPHETRFLPSFNSGVYLGDHYAGIIHGWLHPQESGDYKFWLSNDENGELYLSSDESPSNIQLIAQESSWSDPFIWHDDESMSSPIPLVGGRKYYIMALWKEGGGGDHCMVAWQGPDQPLEPEDGNDFAIIPGGSLSPPVQFYAHDPDPCDGLTGVSLPVTLKWEPGDNAAEHIVYLGTDFNDVKYTSSGVFLATTTEPNIIVTDLAFNTRYYWRVDEYPHTIPELTYYLYQTHYKGDVWSFTTGPQPIYVDIDANGANNGTSWENAYNYLRKALEDANSSEKPVEIRVAQGVYKPNQGLMGIPGVDWRLLTFKLISGVTVKGGYAGFGEPNPDARDIKLYETILSGDLNGNDEPNFINYFENSCHVVTISGTVPNTILDGLTITAGNAHGYSRTYGGGIYCTSSSKPMIINCNISNNRAEGNDGVDWGMEGGSGLGGGIYSTPDSHPTFQNCIISNNEAHGGTGAPGGAGFGGTGGEALGGGIYGGNLTVENCIIVDNRALGGDGGPDIYGGGTGGSAWGGGICCGTMDSVAEIPNCLIMNNAATGGNSGGDSGTPGWEFGGGVASIGSGTTTITNCTITNNTAEFMGFPMGGGVYHSKVFNCILWDNTGDLFDGSATYSCIEDNVLGTGNIHDAPCFVNANNGEYHLKSQAGRWNPSSQSWVADDVTSPCIDAGNPGCPLGDEPLPNGNRRNMGAYGGTAEASKSPPNWRSIADMTNDWVVDYNDLKIFVDYWLESGECIPCDLNRSQSVDFSDFAIFGLQWSYPSGSEPDMTFHIDDCNTDVNTSEEPNEPRFSVWVEGSYIHFEDLMYANCCPDELGLEKEINGNHITLYEIGYGGLCDCMCYFPIKAKLGPFEDGTYTVAVYDNYGNLLGVVEVTIGEVNEPGITYQIEDCDLDAYGEFSAEPTRFTVTVDGLYIHFEDMMVANCCPDGLGLEMTVEDDLITIYETEYTPAGCFCICDYPVTATLGPFEPGTYILEVYEDWGGFIGSTTVVIEAPG